ncbi:MAG: hypoxanthine phosphoribosyltransferase [Saprospiraceae bacterium]
MSQPVELHGRLFHPFITAEQISARINTLASELDEVIGLETPIALGVLNGAILFHSDLIRACSFDVEVAYLRTRSYSGMKSSGKVDIEWPDDLSVNGRHVLLVEDIVDSGRTLVALSEELLKRGAVRVTSVVLLDKPDARVVPYSPDFTGFDIPNAFVIGYGLDFDGLGRNLSAIYQVVEE